MCQNCVAKYNKASHDHYRLCMKATGFKRVRMLARWAYRDGFMRMMGVHNMTMRVSTAYPVRMFTFILLFALGGTAGGLATANGLNPWAIFPIAFLLGLALHHAVLAPWAHRRADAAIEEESASDDLDDSDRAILDAIGKKIAEALGSGEGMPEGVKILGPFGSDPRPKDPRVN